MGAGGSVPSFGPLKLLPQLHQLGPVTRLPQFGQWVTFLIVEVVADIFDKPAHQRVELRVTFVGVLQLLRDRFGLGVFFELMIGHLLAVG